VREGTFRSVGSTKAVCWTILVGILTGIDVSLSNLSYLRVSIPFMEMVKSSSPVFVLLLSFAAGIEKPTLPLISSMLLMSGGLAMSVEGEVAFDGVGFAMCLGAGFTAASRLVVSHIVLHGKGKDRLDPISLLYIVAPTCAAVILPVAVPLEMGRMAHSRFTTDPNLMREAAAVVFGGGVLAINLNFSEFLLLGKTSALTLNVAGILKVVAVSALSIALFHAKVSPLNAAGYFVCVMGVFIYNRLKSFRREEKQQVAVVDGESLVFLTCAQDEAEEGGDDRRASVRDACPGVGAAPSALAQPKAAGPGQPKKVIWQPGSAQAAIDSEKSCLLAAPSTVLEQES